MQETQEINIKDKWDKWPTSTALKEQMKDWIDNGIYPTNKFIYNVIRNDLLDTCKYAENDQRALIWSIVQWLNNYAPIGCYGNDYALSSWPSNSNNYNSNDQREEDTRARDNEINRDLKNIGSLK